MISPALVVGISFGYLLLLFGVAYWADRRAALGRSVIDNAWMYALSMAVYCTAWTYFGSVGRAATGGMWFLPIYFGPTLAMLLGWMVLRKMNRIAKAYRITSIADFIGSRYGKSPVLAGLVTLIAVVGIVPYIALQLKAVSAGYAVLTSSDMRGLTPDVHWTQDTAFYVAMVLAGFTMVFGARHLDSTERHEGMVAAIAFESVIKLVAFLAVGGFVVWGLFDGLGDVFARAAAEPATQKLLSMDMAASGVWAQWFALTLLAMLSVLLLPRQFQVMVVENVRESHLRRALWVFPLYMLLINLFVLPIALGGLLYFETGSMNPENFVLSLPLADGQYALAMLAFIGGLSAATGMVIVETIAVSTMVSNELVLPLVLRWRKQQLAAAGDVTRMLLSIRRAAILGVLLLGYVYYHLAGEAYALVSIGLISFAAVAQFAPALFGGIFWKGGTKLGALVGLSAGFAMWTYTLMLPSIAKSGWLSADFLQMGLWGQAWLRPEQFLGLTGLDPLTHSLFWSLLVNAGGYVLVSLWRAPSGAEASQALLFVDVFERTHQASPVFWRGRAQVSDLAQLCERFLGRSKAEQMLHSYAQQMGLASAQALTPDARLVQFVEMQLAGAVGSASARVLVASVAQEEALTPEDVLSILDEASQLRSYSRELEEKSQSLQLATDELRRANEQLKSLDLLKDDFMSSVTHELRTPLTSIRALAELMRDDPGMDAAQRQQFIAIIVSETERLSRLVNQVLDMAKIESGHAEWVISRVDMDSLIRRAVVTTGELFHEKQIAVELALPADVPKVQADEDRLMQVMMNLLSNAAKFVPVPGGRVQVGLQADAQGLTVSVQDNGPGVPPEQQALIFEKFRQGGRADHRPQGTGLGLPISRDIVAHFGGRLWLDSVPGQGAKFSFFLPWIMPAKAPAAHND
jgi:Na+/proline symporter/nitrogen-specific signal transduction histidine kinase